MARHALLKRYEKLLPVFWGRKGLQEAGPLSSSNWPWKRLGMRFPINVYVPFSLCMCRLSGQQPSPSLPVYVRSTAVMNPSQYRTIGESGLIMERPKMELPGLHRVTGGESLQMGERLHHLAATGVVHRCCLRAQPAVHATLAGPPSSRGAAQHCV
jgi:hypothetical protein